MKNLSYWGYIKSKNYKNELIYINIFSLIKDAPIYTKYLYLFTEDTTKVYLGYLIPNKSAALIVSSFKLYKKIIKKSSRPIR